MRYLLTRCIALATAVMTSSVAWATVAPECQGIPKPGDYNEVVQGDFLLNYFALSTTLSPIHGPIPHEGGRGAIGVDLAIIPPLSCEKRFVLNWSKTEDTNATPLAPKIRLTYSFPEIAGVLVPYGGFAYLPPVNIGGTRSVIMSGEIGVGARIGDIFQAGGRFHATVMRTIGDVAGAFDEDDPIVDDLYFGSTFGFDAMLGADLMGYVTPFAAVGFTDVSTFFWIGDDGFVGNNYHPYSGLTFSVGAEGLVKNRFRWGAEFYGAPGGYNLPDKSVESVKPAGRYGHLYTARIRLAVEL